MNTILFTNVGGIRIETAKGDWGIGAGGMGGKLGSKMRPYEAQKGKTVAKRRIWSS